MRLENTTLSQNRIKRMNRYLLIQNNRLVKMIELGNLKQACII
jgi:hypothetical protein